ncbi:MAG: TldD/PmbA family protein [Bacilli bacterium]|nr:TldD/PmbA family protein [Bacilli bacterium]
MFNKKTAKHVLQKCLKTGADFSEIYIENVIYNSILCDNEIIEKINNHYSSGIGIRIFKKNISVYGCTNNFNKKNLDILAEQLSNNFQGTQNTKCNDFIDKKVKNIFEIKKSYFNTPIEEKIFFLKNLCKKIKNKSKLINRVICNIFSSKKDFEIFNSAGLHAYDKRERIGISINIKAIKSNKQENIYDFFYLNSMSDLKKIDFDNKISEMISDLIGLLNAKRCPSKKMTVIIGNGNGGTLFHEACGHALEASSVAYNLSVFSNRLNTKISSSLITAYDDGTIKNAWGSNNIDDEGNETQKICLIENGILKNYLIDNFNGRKMGQFGNGACRRQNYKFEPTSRMSNTFIANGQSSLEEIIKNTNFGLYAKKISGGSVDTTTGEFEFAVDIAYMIKNGKICEQVKGAMLIGKCEEILKNIDMVGNDLVFSPGICGASSGDIPVNVGQPTIRVKSILVGGNKNI